LVLHVGTQALRAAFEPGRSTEDRISAVQYVRFPLPETAKQELLTTNTLVSVEIDHANYQHRTVCAETTRAALAADYRGNNGD
jgi:hypothetical protein